MKQWILPTLLFTLAACGKGGTEKYIGYWQQQDDKRMIVSEIKQENGNYFAVANIVAKGKASEKQMVLSEKDGELVANNGIADIPLKLSDDGQSLFVGKKTFKKIDIATKDKIMAHEASCQQLTDEFNTAEKSLPSAMSNEYKPAKEALKQKYFPQFDALEKEMPCNTKPGGYKFQTS